MHSGDIEPGSNRRNSRDHWRSLGLCLVAFASCGPSLAADTPYCNLQPGTVLEYETSLAGRDTSGTITEWTECHQLYVLSVAPDGPGWRILSVHGQLSEDDPRRNGPDGWSQAIGKLSFDTIRPHDPNTPLGWPLPPPGISATGSSWTVQEENRHCTIVTAPNDKPGMLRVRVNYIEPSQELVRCDIEYLVDRATGLDVEVAKNYLPPHTVYLGPRNWTATTVTEQSVELLTETKRLARLETLDETVHKNLVRDIDTFSSSVRECSSILWDTNAEPDQAKRRVLAILDEALISVSTPIVADTLRKYRQFYIEQKGWLPFVTAPANFVVHPMERLDSEEANP